MSLRSGKLSSLGSEDEFFDHKGCLTKPDGKAPVCSFGARVAGQQAPCAEPWAQPKKKQCAGIARGVYSVVLLRAKTQLPDNGAHLGGQNGNPS